MSNESISFISGLDKAIRDIFCFAYTLGLLELPIYICGEVSKKDCQGQYCTGQGSCSVKKKGN